MNGFNLLEMLKESPFHHQVWIERYKETYEEISSMSLALSAALVAATAIDKMHQNQESRQVPKISRRFQVSQTAPPSPAPSHSSVTSLASRHSLDSLSLCLPQPTCWKIPVVKATGNPYDVIARIILLGDYNVGKTSILRSLSRAKDETGSACCCEFRPGELVTAIFRRDRKQSMVKVMDTGGQERYRSMTSSYYRGVHGCLLVFDVTREDTFHNIVLWHQDLQNYTGNQFVASILVGTTSHPGQRVVSAERAFKMAESLDMVYLETDTNDDVMTIAIVQRLLDTIIREGFKSTSASVIIVPQIPPSSSGRSHPNCAC